MVSSKSFSVNPKKAACGVKSYKGRWFSEKVFKSLHNAFATKQRQKRGSIVSYFGYKKNIDKFQIYQKRRPFHLNKVHYFKPYIGSSVYRDRKLQCVEEHKYTFNQVRSR